MRLTSHANETLYCIPPMVHSNNIIIYKKHPTGTVLPISSAACNVVGKRVYKGTGCLHILMNKGQTICLKAHRSVIFHIKETPLK